MKTRPALWCALGALALFATSCGESQAEQTIREAEIFGTRVTVIVAAPETPENIKAIDAVLIEWRGMHKRFHAWRGGELSLINSAIAKQELPVTLSQPMAVMLSQSIDYAGKSGQLFNPAAGRLFALWGFHQDNPAPPPPSFDEVAKMLAELPSMNDIQLDGQVLASAPRAAQFDLGAVAKGAALDRGRDILREYGIENALLNVGGNLLALGQNGSRPWQVLIAPAGQTITLQNNEAIATSGKSARFYEYDGKEYHHIIDLQSGAPANHHSHATAISRDPQHAGAISDAAATALMAANAAQAEKIAARFGLVNALLVGVRGEEGAVRKLNIGRNNTINKAVTIY